MVHAGRLPLMIRRGPPILLVQKTKGGANDLTGAAIVTSLDLRSDERGQFGRETDVQRGFRGHQGLMGRVAALAIHLP